MTRTPSAGVYQQTCSPKKTRAYVTPGVYAENPAEDGREPEIQPQESAQLLGPGLNLLEEHLVQTRPIYGADQPGSLFDAQQKVSFHEVSQ